MEKTLALVKPDGVENDKNKQKICKTTLYRFKR